MEKKKYEVAKTISTFHSQMEPGMRLILNIVSPEDAQENEPIKLLEVNEEAVPSGIVPVYFGPGGEINYSSVIVEVTPEEYEMLRNKKLQLPESWEMGEPLFTAEH